MQHTMPTLTRVAAILALTLALGACGGQTGNDEAGGTQSTDMDATGSAGGMGTEGTNTTGTGTTRGTVGGTVMDTSIRHDTMTHDTSGAHGSRNRSTTGSPRTP